MNTSLPKARPGWLALALGAGLLAACASDSGTPPEIDPCDLSIVVPDESKPGVIYTYAGTGRNGFITSPNQISKARFSQPADIVFDDDGVAFVCDWNNHMVRRIDTDGTITTAIGLIPPFPGDGPGLLFPEYNDVEGPIDGQYCLLNHPTEMNPLPDGTFALTAWHNHKIRIFDPVAGTEYVRCGRGAGFGGDGMPHTDPNVKMAQPNQSELGPDGHYYILDQRNQRIRRIRDFMTDADGIIETVAGTGVSGFNGDGLAPLETTFYFDSSTNPDVSGGMVISDDGIIYVADTKNRVIRAIDLDQNVVNIIAGQPGVEGATGDNVDALSATLGWPLDLEIGPDGRLYIADEYAHAIRALDFDTGKIHTVAGQLGVTSDGGECNTPTSKDVGDGLAATDALLNRPRGIAFDPAGRLYIVDTFHNRIRVMTLESTP